MPGVIQVCSSPVVLLKWLCSELDLWKLGEQESKWTCWRATVIDSKVRMQSCTRTLLNLLILTSLEDRCYDFYRHKFWSVFSQNLLFCSIRFEIFMVVIIQIEAFWVVTPFRSCWYPQCSDSEHQHLNCVLRVHNCCSEKFSSSSLNSTKSNPVRSTHFPFRDFA